MSFSTPPPLSSDPRRATRAASTVLALLVVGLVGALALGSRAPGAEARSEAAGAGETAAAPVPWAPRPQGPGMRLPGVLQITDVSAGAEGWVVLDGPGGRALPIGADGAPGRPVGGSGDGPGELAQAHQVARHGPVVAVLDATGTRLDLLRTDGGEPERVRLDPSPDCPGTVAAELLGDARGWWILRSCRGARTGVELVHVGPAGRIRPAVVASAPGSVVPDPLRAPLLARVDGRLWAGDTRSGCFREVAPPSGSRLCVDLPDPPSLPARAREALRRLSARAAAAGAAFEVPATGPRLLELRDVASHLAARTPVDSIRDGWLLVPRSGGSSRRLVAGDLRFEPGPAGVLALRHEADGVRAWVLPLPEAAP